MRRWRLLPGVLAILLSLFCVVPVFAQGSAEGRIQSISVDVELDRSGNASVTEIWQVTVPDDWTEAYTVKSNLRDMEIRNFHVKDMDTGAVFRTLPGDWQVDRPRSEKSGQCGIHRDGDSLELCWGVGSSGPHRFAISYEMTNMVQRYKDGTDGFLVRFVNEGMDPEPESVKIRVHGPAAFSKKDTRMWAFGFEGSTGLENGSVVAKSSGAVNYCNILVQFPKGIFTPESKSSQTFEKVKQKAFEGSSYSENTDARWGVLAGIFAGISLLIFLAHRVGAKRDDRPLEMGALKRESLRNPMYSHEIPFAGNLPEAWLVLRTMDRKATENSLISAYLLQWIQSGQLAVQKMESTKWNLFDDREETLLLLREPREDMGSVASKLWDILNSAAGEDNSLQEKELYRWAKCNYSELQNFFSAASQEGRETGESRGDIGQVERRVLLTKQLVPGLTERGAGEAVKMAGFRHYLKDFTLVNERQARDVGLWHDYLVFAALFGIADQVAKEFQDILPSYFERPTGESTIDGPVLDTWDILICLDLVNRVSAAAESGYMDGFSAEQQAMASAGQGGFSSLGGGGGFSGGGFGGGGR